VLARERLSFLTVNVIKAEEEKNMREPEKPERRDFLRTATGAGILLAAGAAGIMTGNSNALAQQQDRPHRFRNGENGSGFNPLAEKGIPIERQVLNWSDLTDYQYNKREVHPFTRCRIITMNGVEVAATLFKHMMGRMVQDYGLRQKIAVSRRAEQQQQKKVNGLIPADEHTLEVTIGYEQVAVDLTAWLAQNEPDPYVRAALDFALLEDFDHLYRYSNILAMKGRGFLRPEDIVGELTEIMPGRPTKVEHRHPKDSVRNHVDYSTADPLTIMNIMTIVAGEQQTMNYYMNVNNRAEDETLRGLYNEIGMIEEQHVSHYESLMDPTCSWLKCAVMHEFHECYLYYSFMQQEVDPQVRRIWEVHLDMEIGHLKEAVEMYKKYAGKDPAEFLPESLPRPTAFQSNIDYVRKVLEEQVTLTAKGPEYVPVSDLPGNHRYFEYNSTVNQGWVPSVRAVEEHIANQGNDYRFAVQAHPIDQYQNRRSPAAEYPGSHA
jgi:rubrerythrin